MRSISELRHACFYDLKVFFNIANTLCDYSDWPDRIHPDTILVCPDSRTIEISPTPDPDTYLAPEQDQRLTTPPDHRTTIFNLGLVFYELLSNTSAAQLHFPLTLSFESNKTLPSPVIRIIEKCLNLDPSDRYQTFDSLKSDLNHCEEEYLKTGSITSFFPGKTDIPSTLSFSQYLYGRQAEKHQIKDVIEDVLSGNPRCLVIDGEAGCGKTALADTFVQSLLPPDSIFVRGKFSQISQVPLRAFLDAFDSLVDHLIASPSKTDWATRIQHQLAPHDALLVNFIPKLGRLIQTSPYHPLDSGSEKTFFKHYLREFLGCIASAQHPLFFLIDDLQWLDRDSSAFLELLHSILPPFCGLIITHRPLENESDDAFSNALQFLNARYDTPTKMTTRISLSALSERALKDHLMDLFSLPDTTDVQTLTHILYKKTHGNPFFYKQTLMTCYEHKLIRRSKKSQNWVWDQSLLDAIDVSDNVAATISSRLDSIPNETRTLLDIGSCCGVVFDARTIGLALDMPFESVNLFLWKACALELLIPTPHNHYKFSHDLVHHRVYSQLSDDQTHALHKSIGLSLYESSKNSDLDPQLFEIVTHLNIAAPCITEPSEIRLLGDLNKLASLKARKERAFNDMKQYLLQWRNAIQKAGLDTPENEEDFYFSLFEANHLCQNYTESDAAYDQLSQLTTTPENRLRYMSKHIEFLLARSEVDLAISTGTQYLTTCRYRKSRIPDLLLLPIELIKLLWHMSRKNDDDVVRSRTPLGDEYTESINLMAIMVMPLYLSGNVLPLLTHVLSSFNLILKYGHNRYSPGFFAFSGYSISTILKIPKLGCRLSELGYRLLDHYPESPQIATVYAINGIVSEWLHPLENYSDYFQKGYELGLERGDLWFALHCLLYKSADRTVSITEFTKRVETGLIRSQELGIAGLEGLFEIYLPTLRFLQGSISYEELMQFKQDIQDGGFKLGIEEFSIEMQEVLFHIGRHEEGLSLPRVYQGQVRTDTLYSQHQAAFFFALSAAQSWRNARLLKRLKVGAMFYLRYRFIKKWHRYNPVSAGPSFFLLKAELYRLLGRTRTAMSHYRTAIQLSKSCGYIYNAAMALELYGRYLAEQGSSELAMEMLTDASDLYEHVGLAVKLPILAELKNKIRFN